MNFESKEIANLLNANGESVKKAKYPMRKKMDGVPAGDLNAYFMRL